MPELPFKNTQEFCHYVREEAKCKKISINKLFSKPGLDKGNFYKYEKGVCKLTLETMVNILDAIEDNAGAA